MHREPEKNFGEWVHMYVTPEASEAAFELEQRLHKIQPVLSDTAPSIQPCVQSG